MPKGTAAPGKVLPSFCVPMKGLTRSVSLPSGGAAAGVAGGEHRAEAATAPRRRGAGAGSISSGKTSGGSTSLPHGGGAVSDSGASEAVDLGRVAEDRCPAAGPHGCGESAKDGRSAAVERLRNRAEFTVRGPDVPSRGGSSSGRAGSVAGPPWGCQDRWTFGGPGGDGAADGVVGAAREERVRGHARPAGRRVHACVGHVRPRFRRPPPCARARCASVPALPGRRQVLMGDDRRPVTGPACRGPLRCVIRVAGPCAPAAAGAHAPDRLRHVLPLPQCDHPALRHRVQLRVPVRVDADRRARRYFDVLVEDGSAHDRAPSHMDVVVQDRTLHDGTGVHDNARRQHRLRHLPPDQAPRADDRLAGDAAGVEAGGRQLAGVGVDRPAAVVEIEGRPLAAIRSIWAS